MNENIKTLIFVGVAAAAALAGLGASRWSRYSAPQAESELQRMLFPDFHDPLTAARLRISDFDESTGTLRSFEVANEKGVWSIPSHEDYPADAQKQLEQAATSLIDLKKLSVVTKNPSEHALYGVVEPDDKLEPGATGVGKRVAMEDKDKNTICQLIVGKQEPDQPDIRYVRLPGKDSVYRVKVDVAKLSTKFEDWIEKDLLKIDTFDMRQINIDHYKESLAQDGVLRIGVGEKLALNYDEKATKWSLDDLAEGEELDNDKVNDLKNSLDQLKIVNVHRKPAGLGRDLRAESGPDVSDRQALSSLQNRGFALFPDGMMLGTAGEVQVGNANGVRHILRFGSIDLEARSGQVGDGEEQDAEGGEGEKKPKADANANRYLLVMAQFDPSFIQKPELKVKELPPLEDLLKELDKKEEPAADEDGETSAKEGDETPAADGAKSEAAEEESSPEPDVKDSAPQNEGSDAALPNGSGPEELAQAADKKEPPAAGAQEKKDEAPPAEAGEKDKENAESEPIEDPAERAARKKADAERKKQEQDDDRKIDDYKQKLKKGREKVQELNDRFADWYYVVSDSMYHKIELKRSDLIKAKPEEKKPEDKEEGEEKPDAGKKSTDDKTPPAGNAKTPAAPPQSATSPASPAAPSKTPAGKPATPAAKPAPTPPKKP